MYGRKNQIKNVAFPLTTPERLKYIEKKLGIKKKTQINIVDPRSMSPKKYSVVTGKMKWIVRQIMLLYRLQRIILPGELLP